MVLHGYGPNLPNKVFQATIVNKNDIFSPQFSIVECVLSAFTDEFPQWLRGMRQSILFRSMVIFGTFLLGLPMVTSGGIYLLNLVDYSVSGFPLLIVGFLEAVALNWIYGKFLIKIEEI